MHYNSVLEAILAENETKERPVEPFLLQWANAERLRQNDTVYIFDEVGSGKTLSSGLMALTYLFEHPEKRVLIITTNALVKHESDQKYGQFLKNWFDDLPFEALNLSNQVDVCNNHYSNLHKHSRISYGLIIVDEAQLFLNSETDRYKNLLTLRAEKVVFLTATPIQNSINDIYTYAKIAQYIQHKKSPDIDWIQKYLYTPENVDNAIICSNFDLSAPVTRYFKETMQDLNSENNSNPKAKRQLSEIWSIGKTQSKDQVLRDQIDTILKEHSDSHVVIFVQRVSDEAIKLANLVKNCGFSSWKRDIEQERTYAISVGQEVDGYEVFPLSEFKGTENLPTVLLVTYQIGEQGVNLPGFNYVVNYHISAWPGALEQRYGRIDRLNNQNDAIHNCFLVYDLKENPNRFDSSTVNFEKAVSIYLENLIGYLPSKNAVLSKDMILHYIDNAEAMVRLLDSIKQRITNDTEFQQYILQSEEQRKDCNDPMVIFLEENDLLSSDAVNGNDTEQKKALRDIENSLNDFRRPFTAAIALDPEQYLEFIDEMGSRVFYCNRIEQKKNLKDMRIALDNIETLDIDDCTEQIGKSDAYKGYQEYMEQERKNAREEYLLKKATSAFSVQLNDYFEKHFCQNEFKELFMEDYREALVEFYSNLELFDSADEEQRSIIIEALKNKKDSQWIWENILYKLPLFQMFEEFQKLLLQKLQTKKGIIKEKFGIPGPIIEAIQALKAEKESENCCWKGVSDRCFDHYSDQPVLSKNDEHYSASNWTKLAIQYTQDRYVKYIRSNSNRPLLSHLMTNAEIRDLKCIRHSVPLFFHIFLSVHENSSWRDEACFRTFTEKENELSLKEICVTLPEEPECDDIWTRACIEQFRKVGANFYWEEIDIV